MADKKKHNQVNIPKKTENILTPKVLRDRARKYARTEKNIQVLGELKDCFCFRLANEWFCVETTYVSKVVEPARISRMPNQADFIVGMMNLRGEVILIVDMAMLLNLPRTTIQEHSRVIVLRFADSVTGFLADEVTGAISVDTGVVQDPISTIKGVEEGFIKGLFKDKDKHLVWLETERVLSEIESQLFSSHL